MLREPENKTSLTRSAPHTSKEKRDFPCRIMASAGSCAGLRWVRVVLLVLSVSSGAALAEKLDSTGWTWLDYSAGLSTNLAAGKPPPPSEFQIVNTGWTGDPNMVVQTNGQSAPLLAPNQLTNLTDGDLRTFATLSYPAVLLADLGRTNVLHRVYCAGSGKPTNSWPNSTSASAAPLGLIVVYVGNTPTTTNQVAAYTVPYDAGNPVETEADLRFSPAVGRYVRLELQTRVNWGVNYWPGWVISPPLQTNVSWNVGELELYGFTGPAATQTNVNAVVLPAGSANYGALANYAATPLALAAGDLSYYLGELTGLPHPIIPPQNTNQYSGTLYQVADLSSLAPDYATMMANIGSGKLPTNVNATVSGRVVSFSSWPYRTVLWSVWEFLERQGIRWVFPDAHGDLVPNHGLDLSVLPFEYHPSTLSIYANFNLAQLQPWPPWELQSVRQEFLYPWRNHWTCSQNGYLVLGGSEIPVQPPTKIPIDSMYTEGFAGYPHNLNQVVPNRVLEMPAYTNWWGWANTNPTSRIAPSAPGAPAFIMDDPTLISWVASKLTNVSAAHPLACSWPLDLCHWRRAWNLLPMDATTFSQDPYTMASNGPVVPNSVPWVKQYPDSYSGMYYSFVASVARLVQERGSSALVGALAYADVFLPPTHIPALAVFPTNVQVEVCLYGAPNLPMGAAANAPLKAALEGWRSTGARLAAYDYALLHIDYYQPYPQLPVPLVAATVDRARYLADLGALDGGCQAELQCLPYNPWNFYAYPRIRWNTNQTAAQIEQEFFTGYFREAAAPMLAYYQALENYQLSNQANMYYRGYCYGITPGAFPVTVLAQMQTHLSSATRLATNWWVASRVVTIAEGFEWVVRNSGLSSTNLGDLSSFPIFASGQPALNLAQFRVVTNAYQPRSGAEYGTAGSYWFPGSTGGWAWFSAGMIKRTFNFTADATYRVAIHAKGIPAGGIAPILSVYLGPNSATWTVSSTNYSSYTNTITLPAGIWDVVLSFQNSASGGARNVFVDSIQLVPQ